MAYTEKALRFTFSGAVSGDFTASGLRAYASIQSTEGKLGNTAQVKIWGLAMDQMNRFSSTISAGVGVDEFNLVIEAGDMGGQLSKVIDSSIWRSYIDLSGAPESAFVVSVAGIHDAATPNASQSWQGQRNAEDLIAAVAAGTYTVTNNGAHAVLRNPSVQADSILNQVQELASAAGFQLSRGIGDAIVIWPKGGTIDSVVIDIGPNTDPQMVGYPVFYESGIIVTSVYNPEIQIGRQMNVTGSIITKANGKWSIVNVQHELATMLPKAPWFTTALLAAPAS